MNYFTGRNFIIVALLLMSVASGYFAVSTFRRDKGEIYIQLHEIFEELALPFRLAKLSSLPVDASILVPVHGISLPQIDDTWGAARAEGREHEGTDIFAQRGTPIYASIHGYVVRTGYGELGGNFVTVMGAGGRRYYYAHLDSVAVGIEGGEEVFKDTVVGFVGNTGNASGTPPHLHLGVYENREAINPFPLLIDRNSSL